MLARLMVGRDIVFGDYRQHRPRRLRRRRRSCRCKGVSSLDDRGVPALKDVDLDLYAGEILGVAGVAGNGQRELSEVLTGLRALTAGEIRIDGAAGARTERRGLRQRSASLISRRTGCGAASPRR